MTTPTLSPELLQRMDAVSYTHLDVYKRQVGGGRALLLGDGFNPDRLNLAIDALEHLSLIHI